MTELQGLPGLADLLEQLSADRSIVEETVTTIFETVPGYDGVTWASLERSVQRNVQLSIRALRGTWSPLSASIPEADALATERLSQGVALGNLLAGFRVSLSTILRRVLQLAPDFEVSATAALSCSTTLWDLGDAFSARALAVYQRAAIRDAVADSARRTQWIVECVTKGLPRLELMSGAAAYGVPHDSALRALAINCQPETRERVASELKTAMARGMGHLWVAPHGSGLVGLARGEVAELPAGSAVTVAVGPAVALTELPSSFAAAVRVSQAARAIGRTGLVDAQRLSWRMAVTASPETTQALQQRWIAPVLAHGEFGRLILESVAAYLDQGMNIPRAASAIPVHVNTLRYRLHRFQDMTGADFETLDCLFEIAWALAAVQRPGTP